MLGYVNGIQNRCSQAKASLRRAGRLIEQARHLGPRPSGGPKEISGSKSTNPRTPNPIICETSSRTAHLDSWLAIYRHSEAYYAGLFLEWD